MNIRHLVTKSFDSDNEIRRSLIVGGVPLTLSFEASANKEVNEIKQEEVQLHQNIKSSVTFSEDIINGKDSLVNSPLGDILSTDKTTIKPLSQLYDFKIEENSPLAEFLPVGASFDTLVESEAMRGYLANVACSMFSRINPLTNEKDVNKDSFYTPYIPLAVLTGVITPQLDEELGTYFNPEGTVTVAEFLDSLNAIKFGCNANNRRKKTLDRISNEDDFFNEGYQDCVRGISSPFFNLYTRRELMQPITRLEMAYITVVCWVEFMDKFNSLYGGTYYLGINLDWENPCDVIDKFKDGYNYRVSKVVSNDEYQIVSLNIKDYKMKKSMEQYKKEIKEGVVPIPLPMFMSLLELSVLDLFYFENNELSPIKEVSRGELCYFVSHLAKLFPMKYIN